MMTAPPADVTVIVTCYNHQAFVEQCLESILRQTRAPRQVIVIDDRSPDESVDVITRWMASTDAPFRLIAHEKNRGLCPSLNEALALTEGTLLCHISADDWMEPTRIEEQVGAFEHASDDVVVVVGDINEVDAGGALLVEHDFGRRLGRQPDGDWADSLFTRLLEGNPIPAPGVMMRTEVVRAVGGYDESLSFEDYDMWLRLSRRGTFLYHPGIVAAYRILPSSLTRAPERAVAFHTTEARSLLKHVGVSAETDAIIARRVSDLSAAIDHAGDNAAARRLLAGADRATP